MFEAALKKRCILCLQFPRVSFKPTNDMQASAYGSSFAFDEILSIGCAFLTIAPPMIPMDTNQILQRSETLFCVSFYNHDAVYSPNEQATYLRS